MNKRLVAIAGLLIAGFILASGVSAFGMNGVFNRFISADTHNQLEQAIANNDYQAFVKAQTENFPNAPTISEEKFAQIVNQYQFHQKIEAAIAAGNYEEWKTLMQQEDNSHSTYLLSKITAENFHYLTELQTAHQKIQEIETNLGFSPEGKGMGKHMMGHAGNMIWINHPGERKIVSSIPTDA